MVKKIANNAGNKPTNQKFSWTATRGIKSNVPVNIKRIIIINPKDTSYESICAADRREPKKAYLELLAHPEIKTP